MEINELTDLFLSQGHCDSVYQPKSYCVQDHPGSAMEWLCPHYKWTKDQGQFCYNLMLAWNKPVKLMNAYWTV